MISGKTFISVALLGVALLFGCSSANNGPDSGEPISFTVVGSGSLQVSETKDPKKFETYTDQAAFDNALSKYSLQVDGEVVDFTVDQVVLVSMGAQSSGGYSISAESVVDAGDYIELNLILSSPGANCITSQALTHPYQMLKINTQKEVRANERNVVENCE